MNNFTPDFKNKLPIFVLYFHFFLKILHKSNYPIFISGIIKNERSFEFDIHLN